MTEGVRIADQLRRMMFGGAWHGPSVLEALEGVNASAAKAHPIPGAHSIWGLVAHIIATQRIITARLRGETPSGTEADFFPPMTNTSESAWKDAIALLKAQEEELIGLAAALPDDRLTVAVPSGSIPYDTLHGHAQHNAFHAGQIRLLRKALAS